MKEINLLKKLFISCTEKSNIVVRKKEKMVVYNRNSDFFFLHKLF